jgi:hypothetical protein
MYNKESWKECGIYLTSILFHISDILQKIRSAYDKFAKDLGVILPSGIGSEQRYR